MGKQKRCAQGRSTSDGDIFYGVVIPQRGETFFCCRIYPENFPRRLQSHYNLCRSRDFINVYERERAYEECETTVRPILDSLIQDDNNFGYDFITDEVKSGQILNLVRGEGC